MHQNSVYDAFCKRYLLLFELCEPVDACPKVLFAVAAEQVCEHDLECGFPRITSHNVILM